MNQQPARDYIGHVWRRTRGRTLAVIGAVSLLAVAAAACSPQVTVQPAVPGEQTGIAVSGTGRVSVAPDIAIIDVGVETTGETVAEARDAAATASDALRAAVLGEGVEERDLQTRSLNIYPQQRWDDSEGPTIIGYTVSSFIQITVRDIDTASAVLDAAVSAGGDASRVQGIRFTVENPDDHLATARTEAMTQARERAETLAQAAGVSLGQPRTISESTGGWSEPPWYPGPERGAADGGAIPIDPGEQELSISISVVFDIER